MTTRSVNFDDQLYAYYRQHAFRDDPLLAALREETGRLREFNMQIAPEQGGFMALLVELMGARRILEVGTFTGYSSLCMARALTEGGRITCCDVSEAWTGVARRYWAEAGVDDRIELRLGPAMETLRGLLEVEAEGFDLIFFDADKEGYPEYYELGLQLARPGGVILFDNVLWGGSVADPSKDSPSTQAIRALNAQIIEDPRVSASMIPIGDGLTLARKR